MNIDRSTKRLARSLYRAGLSTEEIARRLDVPRDRIRELARTENWHRSKEEKRREAREMYEVQNMRMHEIADAIDIPASTLYKWAKSQGWTLRSPRNRPLKYAHLVDEARALYEDPETFWPCERIARHLAVGRNTIYLWAHRFNWVRQTKPAKKPKPAKEARRKPKTGPISAITDLGSLL